MGGGKRIPPQESLLVGYLFGGIGDAGGYHSLLKDCRLYAPHSQIWAEYKLETASCYFRNDVNFGTQVTARVHVHTSLQRKLLH